MNKERTKLLGAWDAFHVGSGEMRPDYPKIKHFGVFKQAWKQQCAERKQQYKGCKAHRFLINAVLGALSLFFQKMAQKYTLSVHFSPCQDFPFIFLRC